MYHFARSISLSLLQRDACLLTIMLLIDRDLDLFDIGVLGVPQNGLKLNLWSFSFFNFSEIRRKFNFTGSLSPPPVGRPHFTCARFSNEHPSVLFVVVAAVAFPAQLGCCQWTYTHTHIYFRTSSIAHIVLLLCTTIIPFRRLRCAVRQTCVVPAAHLLTLCDAILNTAARMVFSQRGKSVCHVFFFFTFFHLDDKFESSRWVHSAILEVLDKSYLCCRHRYVDWRR